ncbi:TonB family protein [Luteimonas sp. SDU82]|uniref:energy transducer TonB n=1 Tax=Luteimonas sp. SDU82 TaxID=3422592 RepID=UPI003EB8299B
MVLQQTHSARHGAQAPRLDVNRILGISSTLALNVLALAMLLSPMTLPAPPAPAETVPELQLVPIVPVERRVTPPPPEVVPVVPPRVQPRPAMRDVAVAPPAADVPVLVDQGVFVESAPQTPTQDTAATVESSAPLTGMQLQYARAPSPEYPRLAVQRGMEGVVLLRILVDTDGRPLEVRIEQSSGHAVLDREALRHVQRHWRFQPALRDGLPVQAVGLVPIEFRLDRH